ncbi:MAG: proton-conducting transporter membrane subunit [Spirochaetales bacterium]|jgi:formate hydrogenlyase subunit 3/multisubunit Na+/H+ antiporter MnhD subunit|nr:proton-conducting transporter membrane subunit [Spirochaetales bacterium]
MVSPIYSIAVALGAAFLLPLFEKTGKKTARIVVVAVLAALAAMPISWIVSWLGKSGFSGLFAVSAEIAETAGFQAPYSISLQVGIEEALILSLVNITALLGGIFLLLRAQPFWKGKQLVLYLTLLVGVNGLIMTRDLFNVFVFLEITSISIYALIASNEMKRAYEAGFKYIIAGSIASAFFLIGVIYLYRFTGTLSIDQLLVMDFAHMSGGYIPGIGTEGLFGGLAGPAAALFFILAALLIELKPFPANGWSFDAYEAADPAVSAMISAVGATGVLFVVYKLFPLFPPVLANLAVISGAVTFIFSQIIGLRQTNVRRMLGYSSTGQIGLLLLVIGLSRAMNSSESGFIILLLILSSHIFSKAGLFWLSGALSLKNTGNSMKQSTGVQSLLRSRTVVITIAGILLAALAGLPPFPAFWAKWTLFTNLASMNRWPLMALILIGSLIEAGYLFRWFAILVRAKEDSGMVHEEIIPEDVVDTKPQTGSVTSKRGKAALLRLQAFTAKKAAANLSVTSSALADKTKQTAAQADREGLTGSVSDFKTTKQGAAAAPLLAAVILLISGIMVGMFYLGLGSASSEMILLLPVAALLLGGLFDLLRIPFRVQLFISLAGIGLYSYKLLPLLEGIPKVFGYIFLLGSAVQLVVLFQRKGRDPGLAALVSALIFSLGNLLMVESRLGLFFSWVIMTVVSYILILRGRKSSGAGLRYLIFSLGGAYSMLMGLMLLPGFELLLSAAGEGVLLSQQLVIFGQTAVLGTAPVLAGILLAAGLLIKMGSLGVHVWLPGAYAEAEDEISSLLSSVLSKAGLFMLFMTAALYIVPVFYWVPDPQSYISLSTLLGWLGAFTALAGAFLALFQEDIKYTLAYSSMGQVGYMLLSFALMSQLGWINSLYLAVTHLLFKSMLFIAVAGVIYRTKTRMMYQMGGLISRMPFSFITVLIGIIAISGVPPLTGFGAKWMLYTALIEKGWYLQAAVAMFASGIAFLYLFRLIHSIFLGQLKDDQREVKEAPVWYLIPQAAAIIGIVAFSMFPNLILKPLQAAVSGYFPETLNWDGYTVLSTLGYWNGNAVMYVTMGVFLAPLAWLLLMQRKNTRKVKQFNIVFAAERPDRPETTHYAYNFFAPYREALGSFLTPWATRFWESVQSVITVIGSSLRRIYTGNGQTYALHILLYTAVLLLIVRGGH